MSSLAIMAQLSTRLMKVAEDLEGQFIQTNGQRVFSRRGQPQPPKGTEIFIGRIPRMVFEDELIPLMETVGKLFQFRIMLDFTYKNRGFAFATFSTVEEANMAVKKFNDFEIRPNVRIGVFKSVDNCRLFFGNIPSTFSKADVLKLLSENFVEGVSDVIMYRNHENPNLNRGFVFVEFGSHRDAAMARRQLYPGCLIVEGQSVFVDWADPIPDVDPKVMQRVTKLFLSNIPLDLTSDELFDKISELIDSTLISKVHKHLDYAFVHFATRATAENALKALTGITFGAQSVKVEWARPRFYSKQNRMISPPTNFCLSLPPKMRKHVQHYINELTSSNDSGSGSSNSGSSVILDTPSTSPQAVTRVNVNRDINDNNRSASQPNNNLISKNTNTTPRNITLAPKTNIISRMNNNLRMGPLFFNNELRRNAPLSPIFAHQGPAPNNINQLCNNFMGLAVHPPNNPGNLMTRPYQINFDPFFYNPDRTTMY